MISAISVIFAPFVFLIEQAFLAYRAATGSAGASILLTSMTFAIAVFPLQRWAKRFENRINARHELVRQAIAGVDRNLRGERRFNEIERIYQQHNYHPIHSIALGLSFFVSVPFLIASALLFSDSSLLPGNSFLFIVDLSQPDAALRFGSMTFNMLPLALFVFTFVDAKIRYKENPSARHRFMAISIVLTVLVYALPSGLLIYWIGANAMSFAIFLIGEIIASRRSPAG